MTKVFKLAKIAPAPKAAARYEGDGLPLLVAFCRELQQVSGDKSFCLGCCMNSGLLGVTHVTAWRRLMYLTHDKIIAKIEKGDHAHHRASRNR
jgi:hypothetical protein